MNRRHPPYPLSALLCLALVPASVAAQEANHVAGIARELTGSPSEVVALNRGPKNRIETGKIRALGMTFGGEELLRRTVRELIDAHRRA